MSYDDSDDADGEWEVVDIVHTTTSVKPDKKPKTAKKEDVDKLAAELQAQLSLKSTQDTQQILLLEQKLKQQQQVSAQQLSAIQSKLNELTRMQQEQQVAKQQMMEQKIQIQSLSDNQMLTQKQLLEAHQQIQQTQQVTQNVNENIQNLQHLQQQQALQQQLTEQQIQQQTQELQAQLQQQQQLAQLAQIAAQQTQLSHQLQQQQTQPFSLNLPPLQQPSLQQATFNLGQPQNVDSNPNTHSNNNSNTTNSTSNNSTNSNSNSNNNNNNNNNSWLPSFFVFGKNGNNPNNNNSNNLNVSQIASNTNMQDMDMASSPVLSSHVPVQPLFTNGIGNALHNVEEKSNILMEHDDDDDVLRWQNDYGTQMNPLYQNPELLKTKGVIGEGKFVPNEKRQCGWILQNKSQAVMKLSARLECIGGDKEQHGMKIQTEKVYEFELKPNEEVYILIEVEAPPMPGKYCAFYQLVTDNGVKVGEMLEVMCEVEKQFSDKREQKIAQIIKMGFDDRKKVISVLQKNKWNVQQSVDQLIGL